VERAKSEETKQLWRDVVDKLRQENEGLARENKDGTAAALAAHTALKAMAQRLQQQHQTEPPAVGGDDSWVVAAAPTAAVLQIQQAQAIGTANNVHLAKLMEEDAPSLSSPVAAAPAAATTVGAAAPLAAPVPSAAEVAPSAAAAPVPHRRPPPPPAAPATASAACVFLAMPSTSAKSRGGAADAVPGPPSVVAAALAALPAPPAPSDPEDGLNSGLASEKVLLVPAAAQARAAAPATAIAGPATTEPTRGAIQAPSSLSALRFKLEQQHADMTQRLNALRAAAPQAMSAPLPIA